MSTADDDDLKLQRASVALLSDIRQLLPRLLRKRRHDGKPGQLRQQVRDIDLYKACALVRSLHFQVRLQWLTVNR